MTTYRPSTDRPLWLHLESRWESVIRIAQSHPEYRWLLAGRTASGKRIRRMERDDLNQELLLELWRKQGGDRPSNETGSTYNPTRAGVAKYLFTATQGVLRHLVEQATTLKATRIEVGATVTRDGEVVTVDAAEVAVADWVEPFSRLELVQGGPEPTTREASPKRARRKG